MRKVLLFTFLGCDINYEHDDSNNKNLDRSDSMWHNTRNNNKKTIPDT